MKSGAVIAKEAARQIEASRGEGREPEDAGRNLDLQTLGQRSRMVGNVFEGGDLSSHVLEPIAMTIESGQAWGRILSDAHTHEIGAMLELARIQVSRAQPDIDWRCHKDDNGFQTIDQKPQAPAILLFPSTDGGVDIVKFGTNGVVDGFIDGGGGLNPKQKSEFISNIQVRQMAAKLSVGSESSISQTRPSLAQSVTRRPDRSAGIGA